MAKDNFPKQAIILAAGLGTRLRPLTHRVPKPGLPVRGIPILLFNLFLLKEAGIHEVTLNLHHLPQALKKLLHRAPQLGLKIHYSRETKILGTAGGIAKALGTLRPRTTLILNGDIVTDLDLHKMNQVHQRTQACATLGLVPTDRARVKSFVEFNAAGRILKIAGRPKSAAGKAAKNLTKGIFSGTHIIHPSLFARYPKNTFGCVIRQIYQPALELEKPIQSYLHRGAWWDLGNLEELKRVDQLLWEGGKDPTMDKMAAEVFRWSRPLFA